MRKQRVEGSQLGCNRHAYSHVACSLHSTADNQAGIDSVALHIPSRGSSTFKKAAAEHSSCRTKVLSGHTDQFCSLLLSPSDAHQHSSTAACKFCAGMEAPCCIYHVQVDLPDSSISVQLSANIKVPVHQLCPRCQVGIILLGEPFPVQASRCEIFVQLKVCFEMK